MRKLGILLLIMIISGCSGTTEKIIKQEQVMGTNAEITFYTDGDGDQISENVFDEIRRIEKIFSTYDNQSEASILNQDKRLSKPSDEFLFIIQKSLQYSELSEGAFDISVQPILDLYGKTFGKLNRAPTDQEIEYTLANVGYEGITIKPGNEITLQPKMRLTFGGIAKGYAIDRAVEILRENNVRSGLVNIGGDMRAFGTKQGEPWTIGLKNPRDPGEFITIIKIENKSVATSGDYERYFINKSAHHIIDPKTGKSALGLISVTIIADDAMDADALATSVFVMGKERGLDLIESLDDVEVLIISDEKEIIRSSGFEEFEMDQ
jgi:thiamine biosynthesis lipoprotein